MTKPIGSQILEWLAVSFAAGACGWFFVTHIAAPMVLANLHTLHQLMGR